MFVDHMGLVGISDCQAMMPIWDEIVKVMSIKPAQRRTAQDIARQIDRDKLIVQIVLNELMRIGLVKAVGALSVEFVLTSEGNTRRNQLLS